MSTFAEITDEIQMERQKAAKKYYEYLFKVIQTKMRTEIKKRGVNGTFENSNDHIDDCEALIYFSWGGDFVYEILSQICQDVKMPYYEISVSQTMNNYVSAKSPVFSWIIKFHDVK